MGRNKPRRQPPLNEAGRRRMLGDLEKRANGRNKASRKLRKLRGEKPRERRDGGEKYVQDGGTREMLMKNVGYNAVIVTDDRAALVAGIELPGSIEGDYGEITNRSTIRHNGHSLNFLVLHRLYESGAARKYLEAACIKIWEETPLSNLVEGRSSISSGGAYLFDRFTASTDRVQMNGLQEELFNTVYGLVEKGEESARLNREERKKKRIISRSDDENHSG